MSDVNHVAIIMDGNGRWGIKKFNSRKFGHQKGIKTVEKIISETEDGTEQIRLTINTFRDIEYLHLRKYYLDFDGDFKPSKDGVAMKLDFNNSKGLFEGLVEILSLAESKNILETHFKDILDEIYLN